MRNPPSKSGRRRCGPDRADDLERLASGSPREGTFLKQSEREAVVVSARAAVPEGTRIVGGVVGNSTRDGIDQLLALKASGAGAALVFPVRDWMISRQAGPGETYFSRLSKTVDLSLFIFQSPYHRGRPHTSCRPWSAWCSCPRWLV